MFRDYLALHFIDNKYAKCYARIIDAAILLNRIRTDGYFEMHHILPKSKKLYPQFASLKDNPWNGVLLTPREHFICHLLLAKCFIGPQKHSMLAALRRMCFGTNNYAARRYERVRTEWLKVNSGETHASYGVKFSDETRRKMSLASKGKKKTAEHRAKIGDGNARRNWTDASRAKSSASHMGKKLTDEHREKIRQQNLGENNAMFGRKWIYHEDKQLSFTVKPNDVQKYIDAGWQLGPGKYPDRSGKVRGLLRNP